MPDCWPSNELIIVGVDIIKSNAPIIRNIPVNKPFSVKAVPNILSNNPMHTNCTTVIKKTPIVDLHQVSKTFEDLFVRLVQQNGAIIL